MSEESWCDSRQGLRYLSLLQSLQTDPRANPAFYSMSTSFFFLVGLSGWGVRLTTHQCNAGIRNERNYTTTTTLYVPSRPAHWRFSSDKNLHSWFQAFAVFCMLYAFFWVITQRPEFICRRFGTLCLFHLHRQVGVRNDWGWEMLGDCTRSPFLTWLSRRAQYGTWSSFGKRVWFAKSHIQS